MTEKIMKSDDWSTIKERWDNAFEHFMVVEKNDMKKVLWQMKHTFLKSILYEISDARLEEAAEGIEKLPRFELEMEDETYIGIPGAVVRTDAAEVVRGFKVKK